MPFIAEKPNTGEPVRPGDIVDKFSKSDVLTCPYCRGNVRFRERATDDQGNTVGRAHFWHFERSGGGSSTEAGGCEAGGESPEHERHKLAALDQIEEEYFGNPFVERQIGNRVADCGVEYSRMRGDQRGVVAEIQYKHEDKDIRRATKDFLKHGFAVHWVFATDGGWEQLYDAKEILGEHQEEGPFLGHIEESETVLGEAIWFDDLVYDVAELSDLIKEDYNSVKIKVELPFVPDGTSSYIVIEQNSIDQEEPEIKLDGQILRVRPSKAIARAKFD